MHLPLSVLTTLDEIPKMAVNPRAPAEKRHLVAGTEQNSQPILDPRASPEILQHGASLAPDLSMPTMKDTVEEAILHQGDVIKPKAVPQRYFAKKSSFGKGPKPPASVASRASLGKAAFAEAAKVFRTPERLPKEASVDKGRLLKETSVLEVRPITTVSSTVKPSFEMPVPSEDDQVPVFGVRPHGDRKIRSSTQPSKPDPKMTKDHSNQSDPSSASSSVREKENKEPSVLSRDSEILPPSVSLPTKKQPLDSGVHGSCPVIVAEVVDDDYVKRPLPGQRGNEQNQYLDGEFHCVLGCIATVP